MGVPYDEAVRIRTAERDIELGLDGPSWPIEDSPLQGWETREGHLYRQIDPLEDDEELATPIDEAILRFPSAPLYSFQRLNHSELELDSMHTYRVLRAREHSGRVTRIFLMHNGLDELGNMSLYYRLASQLIQLDPGTVCIVRPFPGHLTRSPFQAFAETPLGTYLWDGSNLFRHFLRYMIETHWFLSVLARRSSYRCASGINLLAEERDGRPDSRLEDEDLASAMYAVWDQIYRAADPDRASGGVRRSSGREARPLENEQPIREAITALRTLLRFPEHYPGVGGELPPALGYDEDWEPTDEPPIHVIGYSLGGFTAQSTFMSWPFMVASCATLLSGGALRELAPTAFADPEEWQTVLHSLRYELDDALMRQPSQFEDSIAGIDRDLFLCLQRTFYEVFQQEYRGSFKTRLAAFRRRMLFVVGGNDPIVRPESVLDSAPAGGVNMVTIGGLGHFIGTSTKDKEEHEQRAFWLPRVGELIDSFADAAAERQDRDRPATWLDSEMSLPQVPPVPSEEQGEHPIRRLDVAERLAIGGDGSLHGDLFRRSLNDLLARVHGNPDSGVLFVLRNEVPTLLLEDRAIHERAAALQHDDTGIAAYIRGVRERREVLLNRPDRISVVLPWNAKDLMETIDLHPRHPSQAETVGSMVTESTTPEHTWREFETDVEELTRSQPDLVRIFDGADLRGATAGYPDIDIGALKDVAQKKKTGGEELRGVPSLPDCWVWMSRTFLYDYEDYRQGYDNYLTIAAARERLCRMAGTYYSDDKLLAKHLREDEVRIVSVSRARFNPRFRGRIVADPKVAKHLLLHVAFCVAASYPFASYDLERQEVRRAQEAGGDGLAAHD